jgi:hypothetical protein
VKGQTLTAPRSSGAERVRWRESPGPGSPYPASDLKKVARACGRPVP